METDELEPLIARRIATFAATLRRAGLPADRHAVLLFTRSLAELGGMGPEAIYWAGRLCFVKRIEQLDIYEREFLAFMQAGDGVVLVPRDREVGGVEGEDEADQGIEGVVVGVEKEPESDAQGPVDSDESASIASALEVLRSKDFAEMTIEEAAALKRLIPKMRTLPPTRLARRMGRAPRGRALDLRRMMTESVRTEGDPIERRWQQRVRQPRRVVFLLDISGSMKAYSRSLLQFAYALRKRHRRTEVFCFGTSLTRVTRHLDASNIDTALAKVGRVIPDWEGGTRIGDSLKAFIDDWGRRGTARGAVVVICSDGLERSDPDQLAYQMQRLGRLSHDVIWLNPLKGSEGYEPLARGMRAALPHVDTFLPGHNLSSLEELARVLAQLPRTIDSRS